MVDSIVFRWAAIPLILGFSGTNIIHPQSPQSAVLAANPPEILRTHNEVRSLPGQLDQVPMFNSNSPEWVKKEGILLSTFPPTGKAVPNAHLNVPFQGSFTLFAHHFVHTPPQHKTLYLGILVYNPTAQPVKLEIPAAASYLLEPEAPFQNKPPLLENPTGAIFSGPGIRAVDQVLRNQRQSIFPASLTIPGQQSRMLLNLPIPVRNLPKAVNGRSSFMRLHSSGPVYLASLLLYAQDSGSGQARPPTLAEWQQLLNSGSLAAPRDKTPTPPNQSKGVLIYGRVAGVQVGSKWQATLVDPNRQHLSLPAAGKSISYVINTLQGGRLGTPTIQAAPLLVRYPDTAYRSQANYGVHYDLSLPLLNTSAHRQTVTLTLETPFKEDKLSKGGLVFRQPPWDYPYFRGTVRLRYTNTQSQPITRYFHLWHRRGQQVEPLISLQLAPRQQQQVRVDFLYPPDSVPPQVLTIKTLPRG
ncbi:MAG: DUF3370 domain-containing protein [Acaryochloris sp. RU_4_1]|nr:DUF3370 domain-containing protein [Acaryochloris sp. RU_4_1]NJR53790.1 DUF3370 domain-containing protein [Acaryochloris sp. CRU_2_0]